MMTEVKPITWESQLDLNSLSVALLTISDTRSIEEDKSGSILEHLAISAGHSVDDRQLVKDDIYKIRSKASQWIANQGIQVIITTGGTGFTGRDSTPEALEPLFDKKIDGFG